MNISQKLKKIKIIKPYTPKNTKNEKEKTTSKDPVRNVPRKEQRGKVDNALLHALPLQDLWTKRQHPNNLNHVHFHKKLQIIPF